MKIIKRKLNLYLLVLSLTITMCWVTGCVTMMPGIVNEKVRITRVQDKAAWDLGCNVEDLELTKINSTTYGVKGCNKKATYLLVDCQANAFAGNWASACKAVLNSDITPINNRDRY